MLIRRKRKNIRVAESGIQFCGGRPSAPEKEISDAKHWSCPVPPIRRLP